MIRPASGVKDTSLSTPRTDLTKIPGESLRVAGVRLHATVRMASEPVVKKTCPLSVRAGQPAAEAASFSASYTD
jgi:hypothetical protein